MQMEELKPVDAPTTASDVTLIGAAVMYSMMCPMFLWGMAYGTLIAH
jgi:hypothetical protein